MPALRQQFLGTFLHIFFLIEFLHRFSSPTYQLSTKSKNSKNKYSLKEAPLVDPEPTSDLSNFHVPNIIATNNGNITASEKEPLPAEPPLDTGKLLEPQFNTKKSNNNNQNCWSTGTLPADGAAVDPLESLNIPSNLLTILGKPLSAQQAAYDRRIVLYVLSADDEPSSEKEVLAQLYEEFKEYCACRGFELQLCDLHGAGENFLDPQNWTSAPVDARAGHHLEAECLSAITSECQSVQELVETLLLCAN